MLRYRIIWVGRRARDPLLEAAQDYCERLQHYARTDVVRLREGTMESERNAILAELQPSDHIIALDERGRQLTTAELARTLGIWQQNAARRIVFVIGGASGLHEDVKAKAHETWALSRMTLPHRMAQVILAEQLYRAHTILRGERYHRE